MLKKFIVLSAALIVMAGNAKIMAEDAIWKWENTALLTHDTFSASRAPFIKYDGVEYPAEVNVVRGKIRGITYNTILADFEVHAHAQIPHTNPDRLVDVKMIIEFDGSEPHYALNARFPAKVSIELDGEKTDLGDSITNVSIIYFVGSEPPTMQFAVQRKPPKNPYFFFAWSRLTVDQVLPADINRDCMVNDADLGLYKDENTHRLVVAGQAGTEELLGAMAKLKSEFDFIEESMGDQCIW